MLPPHTRHLLSQARRRHQTIILATGVFDLLHPGHISFLIQAKLSGDVLVVGLESDQRVKQLKGKSRPINPQSTRLHQIFETGLVDSAFILPRHFSQPSQHLKLLRQIQPHILAVSSHSPHLNEKKILMQQIGGQLKIVLNHNPLYSTTKLLSSPLQPNHLLHPQFFSSVESGLGRGRKLGIPTLNLTIPPQFPYRHGVYGGFIYQASKPHLAAFHFGPAPTFNYNQPRLEAHLIHHHPSPPPSNVSFRLVFFLRPPKKFTHPKNLTTQIKKDLLTILQRLA